MRAAVLTQVNQPLELSWLAEPEAGPGQVLVRVSACGLCGTDLHALRGRLPLSLPMTLGHEVAGVVEGLGPGVTALRVGDRVGVTSVKSGCGRCSACLRHRSSWCAHNPCRLKNAGGFAERVVADAAGCTLLPGAISFEQGAALVCAGFAAMSGYRNATPRPGDRIAVLGVGGLGHLALQIAKAMGHEVVAVTRTAEKIDDAGRFGADHVIARSEHPGDDLQAIGGADVILSTSPSMIQNSMALRGLRQEGRFISMAAGGSLRIDPMLLMSRQLSIKGSTPRSREHLIEVLDLAVLGRVKADVEPHPLTGINDAFCRLREGRVRYRAVVTLGGREHGN